MRKKIIKKVDAAGGLKWLISGLDMIKLRLNNTEDIQTVESVQLYYKTMYKIKMDVKKDLLVFGVGNLIRYREMISEVVRPNICDFCRFYLELLDWMIQEIFKDRDVIDLQIVQSR